MISLRVSPGARRTQIEGPYGENALKLRIAAPPAGGKANAELRRYISKLLGVRKSDVEILRGASSRDKTIPARTADFCGARRVLRECLL